VQAVNLKGCFLMFRAAYPYLRDGGHGRVINISSVTFWVGHTRLAHYVASKGGVIGFTRALAREVGTEGITVNAVTPGAILTEAELAIGGDPEQVRQEMARLQSIPRRGLPEDVAGGVVFLASDAASFITGQTLNIDGGWALH
jgi:3-oxoacyl-[acyl-carrier protein] reductase